MQMDRQVVDRKSQLTREELQQKQGAEFDKAFVGTAIPAHIHMIAQLEVIQKQGQGQLAQIAQQALPITQPSGACEATDAATRQPVGQQRFASRAIKQHTS